MSCILFETSGTDGDILPFIRVGRELVNRGHKVAIITHSYYEKMIKKENIDFIPVDTCSEYAQFINDNATMCQSPQGHIAFLRKHVFQHIIPAYNLIKEYYIDNETIIISKAPGFLSTIVSEKLNIPKITVFLAPSFVMTDEFAIMFYNLLKDDIGKVRASLGLNSEYSWEMWWKSSQEYVGFWPEWFEVDNCNSSLKIKKVGFLVDRDKNGSLPDIVEELVKMEDKPILINSSSSSLFINSAFFEASIKACADLNINAILVGRHKEFLPENLPKGIYIFDHLQFDVLMPKVRGIIHHGGIGTLAQALISGLPQLVLAGGVDRPDNAKLLKKLGVGDYLLPPEWKSEYVKKSLYNIINSLDIKKKCDEIQDLMLKEDPINILSNIIEPVLSNFRSGQSFKLIEIKEVISNDINFKDINQSNLKNELGINKNDELREYINNSSQEKLEMLLALIEQKDYPSHKITRIARNSGINKFPVSYIQKEFLDLNQLQPQCLALNMGAAYTIEGDLNIDALEKTFNEVVKRHENLRTIFKEVDGVQMQFILPFKAFNLPIINLENLIEKDRITEAKEILYSKNYERYDLSVWPIIRFLLIKLDKDNYIVWWGMHHILNDGWGLEVLINEVKEIYSCFAFNRQYSLPELKIQCADFAVWQRKVLNKNVLDKKLEYWKRKLGGFNRKLSLPADFDRPLIQTYNGSEEFFFIEDDIKLKFKELCTKVGSTVFMGLLSTLKVLVYYFTDELDIVIGSPISERNREELEPLICDFTNLLVYRTIFDKDDNFYDILEKVKKTAVGSYDNQEVSSTDVFNALTLDDDKRYSPLFQIMFVLHEIFPSENEQFLEGVHTKYLNLERKVSQFDISLFMFDDIKRGLYGKFEYNTDIFARKSVLKFINCFTRILEIIITKPDTKLSELNTFFEVNV